MLVPQKENGSSIIGPRRGGIEKDELRSAGCVHECDGTAREEGEELSVGDRFDFRVPRGVDGFDERGGT